MKRIVILLIAFCAAFPSYGQVNFPALYGNNSPLAGAMYMPAMIGMDRAKVHVDIVNAYAYLGNSSYSYKDGELVLTTPDADNQTVEEMLAKLKDRNAAYAGLTIQPLNFSFKVNDGLAFGFGWAERIETRFAYGRDFLEVVWQGNAPYAGEEKDLGPIDGNVMYIREFGVTGAYHALSTDELSLWVAARPKYLQGVFSLFAPDNNITLYTEENGKYIDVTYDNEIHTSFPDTVRPFKPAGSGFGFDLGGNLQIGERLHASLNLIDLGSVKFKTNASTLAANETVRYRGVELDNIYTDVVVRDSAVIAEMTPHSETNEPYNHPLPAKLILQGAYRIPGTTAGGEDYYRHSFFFTIVQGLSKYSSFGTHNILSVGAATDFGGMFNVGGNINVINFNQLQLGAFLSARLAVVRLGVGTSNLFPLLLKAGPTSDLNVTLGLSF